MYKPIWRCLLFGLMTAVLFGCGSIELVIKDNSVLKDASVKARESTTTQPMDPQRQAALDDADKLLEAISKGAGPSAVAGPPVRWLDARHPLARDGSDPAPTQAVVLQQSAPQPTVQASQEPDNPNLHLVSSTPVPTPISIPIPAPDLSVTTIDYQRIARVLHHQIQNSNDPDIKKALHQSALSIITGQRELDETMLGALDPRKRRMIEQYHKISLIMADRIIAGDSTMDVQAIDEIFANRPISIKSVRLCKRVDNYGVYETFGSNTFVAGRPRPLVIYIELEHFKTALVEDDRHEVRLSQSIMLFNEKDGLLVWQLPKEKVVDRSRNKRRDFFTVQQVVLPANLGTGKFQLKVKVSDLHGQNEDEMVVPIHFIAGKSVVDSKQY